MRIMHGCEKLQEQIEFFHCNRRNVESYGYLVNGTTYRKGARVLEETEEEPTVDMTAIVESDGLGIASPL